MALLFPDLFPEHQYGGDVAASYNALHKNALENAMKQMQGQYYGPLAEAQLAGNREALEASRFKRENPLLGASGLPGELAALDYYQRRENQNQPTQQPAPGQGQGQTQGAYEPSPGTEFGKVNYTSPNEVNRLAMKAEQSLDQPSANVLNQINQAKQVANQNAMINPTPQNVTHAQKVNKISDLLQQGIEANIAAKRRYAEMNLGVPTRGMSVGQRELVGLENTLQQEHPEWSREKVHDAASNYLDDNSTFSGGEKLPKLSGYARSELTQILNRNAPAAVRTQAINMQNLAEDFRELPIDAMASYAGLFNKPEIAKQMYLMQTDPQSVSPKFREYLAYKDVVSNFSMDALRKGFGTSVVPGYVYTTLGGASDPTSLWWHDPQQVKIDFNRVQKWLDNNAGRLSKSAKYGVSANERKESPQKELTYNVNTGEFE